MARKPMGQDEKDKIGQAEMDERRAEERAARGEAEPGIEVAADVQAADTKGRTK